MSQYLTNLTGDVFGLNFVYDRLVDNIENRNTFYWREQPIYSYFSGGQTPGEISTVNRLDFSNETVTNPDKNIGYNVRLHAGLSAFNYGYFVGGVSRNTVSRLDYTNESISLPNINLPANRWGQAHLTSANYGWTASGEDGGPWGFSNPGQNFLEPGPYRSNVFRLDFSNETFNVPGQLTFERAVQNSSVSSANYGYMAGGYLFRPTTPLRGGADQAENDIFRLDFFTETVLNLPSKLSNSRYLIAGTFGLLHGYFAGGASPGPQGGIRCTIDRLDFSNETVSTTTNLPSARYGATGTQNSNYGYFGGGIAGSYLSTITRIDFNNDTVSDPGAAFPLGVAVSASVAGGASALKVNKNYGYFAGGFAPPQISTITRLDFSNDTVSDPGKNLTTTRSELAAVASNYHGYFGGGFSPPQICNITRIDFVNETINQSLGNLPSNRRLLSATESASYGYFAGGFNAPPDNYLSTITRFDFGTEIATDTPTRLPFGRREFCATSTNIYAFFGGGFNTTTFYNTITRLDFSNETISNPGKNLPSSRRNLAVMASTVYGFFGGGESPAPTPFSINTITRLDFASETISTPGGAFTTSRRSLAATASRTYGYWAGGFSPPYISTVTRLDFSNEVVSEPGKTLPSARGSFTALANSN
jgi:hypothetical protein